MLLKTKHILKLTIAKSKHIFIENPIISSILFYIYSLLVLFFSLLRSTIWSMLWKTWQQPANPH